MRFWLIFSRGLPMLVDWKRKFDPTLQANPPCSNSRGRPTYHWSQKCRQGLERRKIVRTIKERGCALEQSKTSGTVVIYYFWYLKQQNHLLRFQHICSSDPGGTHATAKRNLFLHKKKKVDAVMLKKKILTSDLLPGNTFPRCRISTEMTWNSS